MSDEIVEVGATAFCNKCGFIGVPITDFGEHRRPKDDRLCNYMATSTKGAKVTAPAWSEFGYSDPVEVARKRETAPEFPGFVIGWYQRLDGARGYVLEHDPHRIVHVNPVGSVVARATLASKETPDAG